MKQLYRIAILPVMIMCATVMMTAQAPDGYYSSLKGKSSGELKTAVYQLIHNFTQVSSYSDLPKYFQYTDVYPDSRRWWDMYSDIPLYAPSFSGLNREHSFPKSWWGGLTDIPAYVDLNHLYPSEARANQAKSNYPLGTVDRTSAIKFQNGITTVGYPVAGQGGSASYVFEPADEYKGDFARTYFYMVTCYQNLKWNQSYMYMLQQNIYPTLNNWAVKLLLDWNRRDPVSQKEVDRNNVVYGYQNNRNPFIDHPELAEYIWGDKVGTPFDPGTSGFPVGDPELTTPVQGMSLEFGQVALGQSVTRQLFFKGENLTGSLDLSLYSGDKAQFRIPFTSLSAALVNNPDGYQLNITYTPTALGAHTSKLLIAEGGIEGSRTVTLLGECLPVPELGACTAMDATEVTEDSYLAQWTYPASDEVDYWIITRTRYSGGSAVTEEILAEEVPWLISGFAESDSETYAVQSVRLGYRSPMSNVITVSHAGLDEVSAAEPLAIVPISGGMRLQLSAPQSGLRVFDPSGREVYYLETVQNNTEIFLPAGIYILTTREHPHPVKQAVR